MTGPELLKAREICELCSETSSVLRHCVDLLSQREEVQHNASNYNHGTMNHTHTHHTAPALKMIPHIKVGFASLDTDTHPINLAK